MLLLLLLLLSLFDRPYIRIIGVYRGTIVRDHRQRWLQKKKNVGQTKKTRYINKVTVYFFYVRFGQNPDFKIDIWFPPSSHLHLAGVVCFRTFVFFPIIINFYIFPTHAVHAAGVHNKGPPHTDLATHNFQNTLYTIFIHKHMV